MSLRYSTGLPMATAPTIKHESIFMRTEQKSVNQVPAMAGNDHMTIKCEINPKGPTQLGMLANYGFSENARMSMGPGTILDQKIIAPPHFQPAGPDHSGMLTTYGFSGNARMPMGATRNSCLYQPPL